MMFKRMKPFPGSNSRRGGMRLILSQRGRLGTQKYSEVNIRVPLSHSIDLNLIKNTPFPKNVQRDARKPQPTTTALKVGTIFLWIYIVALIVFNLFL